MEQKNILNITTREDFRKWLIQNHNTESECWMAAKRGKNSPTDCVWYLDAVEEVLCFGWIDTTHKKIDGVDMQRFTPRAARSPWSELNKERCRRLEKLGLMTDAGYVGERFCDRYGRFRKHFGKIRLRGKTSRAFLLFISESALIRFSATRKKTEKSLKYV